MEDLYYVGGLPAVMKELAEFLHQTPVTANGKTVKDNYTGVVCYDRNIISTTKNAFNPISGIVVVKGNICEDGAVLKPSAASPHLMKHKGKAMVFENIEDYKHRIDDPALDVDENSVLVLKNVGPKGYPGMPEVGNMGLPKKLLEKGVTDMVRISDGRMSGTGFGTVVLHVCPEAAAGGNFALIQTGDIVMLDIANRSLNIDITAEELQKRKQAWQLPAPVTNRGYVSLYVNTVEQANLGADLSFLKGSSGSEVTRDSH